jgi:hypothetical protein
MNKEQGGNRIEFNLKYINILNYSVWFFYITIFCFNFNMGNEGTEYRFSIILNIYLLRSTDDWGN